MNPNTTEIRCVSYSTYDWTYGSVISKSMLEIPYLQNVDDIRIFQLVVAWVNIRGDAL